MSNKEDDERRTTRVMSGMNNDGDDKRKLPWMIKVMGDDTSNRIQEISLTKKKKKLKKKVDFLKKDQILMIFMKETRLIFEEIFDKFLTENYWRADIKTTFSGFS